MMAAKRALHAIAPSVREVAEILDVAESTVHSWRSGRRTPSAENLLRIAELADARADALRGVSVELRKIAST
jgi:transcriptional regulator with XRE-family HTH domain